MVLTPQANRNWKVMTYVVCSATTFYSVFYATYNPNDPRDHCFTDVRTPAMPTLCPVALVLYGHRKHSQRATSILL